MADSASEFESDTSSVDGGPTTKMVSPGHMEQLNKRIESLQQENRVLRMELDTYKLRCKTLQEDNRELRQASVTIVSCSGQCTPAAFVLLLSKLSSQLHATSSSFLFVIPHYSHCRLLFHLKCACCLLTFLTSRRLPVLPVF